MRRGSQNRAAVERSSRKLSVCGEEAEEVIGHLFDVREENSGRTVRCQVLCVAELRNGSFTARRYQPTLSAWFKRQKWRQTVTVQGESTAQLRRARLGRRPLQRHRGRSGDRRSRVVKRRRRCR